MNDKLLAFLRVIEIDMAFPFLIYFIMIEMIALHEFGVICGIILVINSFMLSFANMLPNDKDGRTN